jgi:hypothetical protein
MRRLFLLVMAMPLALIGYAAAPASAAPVTAQHLSITIGADGNGTVVATGAINDMGTYKTLTSRQAGKSHITHGTFEIDLTAGTFSGKYASNQKHSSLDPTTCTETDTGKGVSIVNKMLGTGAYAGMKGSGHFTFVTTIVGTVTATGCDFSASTGSTQVEFQGKVKIAS